jgi:hypothetical protein
VLCRLVPAVAVLLLPDLALLFTDLQPNTTGLGVAALMHVATAAVAVPIFARALPVPALTPGA